ncbi:MAG: methyltransferase domain-containing protein [Clostridia bacterium]|nr:methyltransferase domain-containing protein [Clostridia bacterium]
MHIFENAGALTCPLCGEKLTFADHSLTCSGVRRHNFDIAKSGYVNLNTHAPTSGDDKEMAKARQAFLRKGYYEPLADTISNAAGKGNILADAGCGEGYYTEAAAKNFDAALGVDLSKYALEIAAKSAKQKGISEKLLYTAASVYKMPLADNSCDCVINVFAPCVEEEYTRILKNGGKLIIAAAGRDHLYGLKSALYDTVIPNEERRDYPMNMRLEKTIPVKYEADILGQDIYSLFMMTPYFYRTKKESAEKLKTMDKLHTLLDFEVRVYIKEEK